MTDKTREKLEFDKSFLKIGEKYLVGIDEVGRGPLAGPVVCCAVVMPFDEDKIIEGIDDSKKLSEKKRDQLEILIKERAIAYSVVEIDEKIIDEINILNATKLGMKKALEKLKIKPDIVLIDAVKIDTAIVQENIIKGDALSYNIASASILAKVHRDRLMKQLDLKYPEYQFSKHKGYGTKLHYEMIEKYGVSEIHRRTFLKNILGDNI